MRGSGASPAAEAIFLAYPVYTHSYLFADGIRDMLRHAFGVSGLYGNQRVFEELRQTFMQPSERLSWQEKVQKLCGEPFTFRYFTQYLARGSAFI
ncbi:hypothetical protein KDJ56_07550 [Brevibacillus composti]|uniref:Uncharacterized protein n=1 Tax=Brevibacillus composti TaxID=2796470 RepID=A0A7T5JQ52_9BACL|nr:hypothetical protein [Brevibacillus composti]QQE75780.1 hypothetical protein JD108_07870 [Brevibacillus composti]QUO42806.1 hypothetical protein KDJ56_07550 [Brevibacillus composti]